MSLVLTAEDNQNGTGITATIEGSDAGSANTVWASPFVLGFGTPSWSALGTRTGDGDVNLRLQGYWWLYATGLVSTDPAVSPPTQGVATQADTAVYTQIKAGVQSRIQSLTLPSLTPLPASPLAPSQVYIFPELDKVFFQLIEFFPAVLITPPPRGAETTPGVLTQKDDIGHPVMVSICDRCSVLEASQRSATYELWRERIFRGLRYQRLALAQTVLFLLPEPGPIAMWERPEYQLFWSQITFRAISRELRAA